MNPNDLPQQKIDQSALARLTLDHASARRYERRFRSAMLPGMLLAFTFLLAGNVLYSLRIVSETAGGILCFAGGIPGLFLAILGYRRVLRQRPLSAQSGREMVPFVVHEQSRGDGVEVAYVDAASGTYFTRLHTTPVA